MAAQEDPKRLGGLIRIASETLLVPGTLEGKNFRPSSPSSKVTRCWQLTKY